ncbi:MAG TPA: zf-HC2 domain-containing protein, partial [Gemmatimonadales bacterium]|nr:zf-HC2 domain-containing protein [Gemmatimonadales bacterium]
MSHVDDGKLNALLDGELDAAEADAVRAHIAACAECARRLEEANQFLAGAADLLGALDLPATANAPATPVRRVSKTAKEVAVDIDGATQKSPAIRPNLPEPAPAARPRFDFTTLSWAAMVVLAIGVGYLANEVRHVRSGTPVSQGARGQERVVTVAAPAAAQPGPHAGASAAALKGGAQTRISTLSRAPAPTGTAGAVPKTAAPAAGKHLVTGAAPTARRRAPAATELAAGAPAREAASGARALAPSPAAPAANRPAAGAAQDLAVSGVLASRESATTFRRVTLE